MAFFSGRGRFVHRENLEAQQPLAFLPCAPGCRGSESDPRYCQCVCRGINHGILNYLRPVQPVPVPQGYYPGIPLAQQPDYPALPEQPLGLPAPEPVPSPVQPKPETERLIFPVARGTGKLARKLGRSFHKAISGPDYRPGQDELNGNILRGLRSQFSEERVNAIVDEAFTEFYSHQPDSNRPELYELYETGLVDHVLDRRGIRWVIGRPKTRR